MATAVIGDVEFEVERYGDTVTYRYFGGQTIYIRAVRIPPELWRETPIEEMIEVVGEERAREIDSHAVAMVSGYTATLQRRIMPYTEDDFNNAYRLLEECLTVKQRRDYRATGTIIVPSKRKKGYKYKILCHTVTGNVFLCDSKGKQVARYCLTVDDVPAPDIILAQKLLLEANEELFLKTANLLGEI